MNSFLHLASVWCPIDLKFTGELEKVHTFEIKKTRGQSELWAQSYNIFPAKTFPEISNFIHVSLLYPPSFNSVIN